MAGVGTLQPTSSRRAFLGGVAGLAGVRPYRSVTASSPTLTVMTRNLYLGVDLFDLYRVDTLRELRHTAGEMLETIEAHPFSSRMDAIAAEIEATRPDVVGIQEAAVVRTQQRSDSWYFPLANASNVVVDLLDLLTTRLAARKLEYEVVGATTTSDIEIPADIDGQTIDVRLTDRTGLLVRRGLEFDDVHAGTFDTAYSPSIGGMSPLRLQRGYSLVDLRGYGVDVTVATAHLEAADDDVRLAQARELRDRLPADRPVVVAGDLNSGPNTAPEAYDLLTRSLHDTHRSMRPGANGYTCCHPADLRADGSRLAFRIDTILYRGDLRPMETSRVGVEPTELDDADSNGEPTRLWPSDHAGVVATFEVAPTAIESTEASAERSSGNDTSPSVPLDGFGSAAAVGALAIAALLRRLRRD